MKPVLAFILSSTVAFALCSCVAGCKADAGKADPTISANAIAQQPLRQSFPTQTEPAPEPQDTRPELVCFGDSITAGYGVDPGVTYPDDLQALLDANGFHYRVVNAGVSGNTSKDAVDRLPRLLDRHPALVVVEFGGNDGLRGLPLEQTQANIAQVIDTLQAAGVKVALAGITLPPDYGPQYIARFDAMYVTLAKRAHVPLMPFVLNHVYGVAGDMQDDGIHPTAQGDKALAANMLHFLRPMLSHPRT
jgi:acyl-CoA thioesterase-1